MDAIRTPEARFAAVPDFHAEVTYLEDLPGYEGLRFATYHQGPADAAHTFLCLHGQPTWAFLYRKMADVFAGAGHRVVLFDLFGFGRSDKPVEDEVYTFDFHRAALIAAIEALDLKNVTLVVQDWGGLLGLTLPMQMPERIARLLIMNTTLATGRPAGPGFEAWRAYNRTQPDLPVGKLLGRSCPHLSEAERAAYDAPFEDVRAKAGVRRFPDLVMTSPDMPGAALSKQALRWLSEDWQGPTFMAIGMTDPVLGPEVMHALRRKLPGCPEPLEVPEAGHFVQEWGGPVAQAALRYFDKG